MNVSVIIPSYNRAEALLKCVRSVLEQDTLDLNLEIIIVDDGSTDDTSSAVKSFNDSRIVYIHQENGGGSKARNTGIKYAKGTYIAFLDSDDEFLPSHIQDAFDFLSKNPDVDVYFSRVKVQRDINSSFFKPTKFYMTNDDMSEYLLCDRGYVPTQTIVVRSTIAKEVMYDEALKMGQDTDFAIRLYAHGAKVFCSNNVGAIWNDYFDPNRVSSIKDYQNRIDWQNRNVSTISKRARRADFGWHIAKAMRSNGMFFKPLLLCLYAISTGCYKPRLAVSVFLQVLLTKKAYRAFADLLVKKGINP
jgi:glycosyltransferase involved in cell wall biosynthesis